MFFNSHRKHGLIVLCATVCASAQTDQQRVQRFATLFKTSTTGRYARMVWQKEAYHSRKPNFDLKSGAGSDIMAMDTKDGKIRTLKASWPNSSSYTNTHLSGASFTKDGSRVIYYDNNRFTVRIIDWDGNNDKVLLTNFEGEGRTWQSSDKKNWVLATEFKNTATGAKLFRINIDNTSERVELYSCGWQRVGYAGSTCWVGLSNDGAYGVGGFPNYGDLSLLTVSSKSLRKLSPNGCWPSISQDNNYHLCYTTNHKEIYITDKDGKILTRKPLTGTPVFGSGATEQYESLRWTSDPDFITFFSAPYDGAYYKEQGTPNPKIVRVSDLAWTAITDATQYPEGNLDVWFYTGSTGVGASPVGARFTNASGDVAGRRFDIRGRLAGRAASIPGIQVSAADGASGLRRTMVSTFAR